MAHPHAQANRSTTRLKTAFNSTFAAGLSVIGVAESTPAITQATDPTPPLTTTDINVQPEPEPTRPMATPETSMADGASEPPPVMWSNPTDTNPAAPQVAAPPVVATASTNPAATPVVSAPETPREMEQIQWSTAAADLLEPPVAEPEAPVAVPPAPAARVERLAAEEVQPTDTPSSSPPPDEATSFSQDTQPTHQPSPNPPAPVSASMVAGQGVTEAVSAVEAMPPVEPPPVEALPTEQPTLPPTVQPTTEESALKDTRPELSTAAVPVPVPHRSIAPPEVSLPESFPGAEQARWSTRAADLQVPPPVNTAPNPSPVEGRDSSSALAAEAAATNPNAVPDPGPTATSAFADAASEPDAAVEYVIPPRPLQEDQINPLTTTVVLNNTAINHLSNWTVTAGGIAATTTNSDIGFDGNFTLNSQVLESRTQDNIYTVDQQGQYLQLRTVPHTRTVTTTTITPQTMLGMELQMSLTGACIFPETAGEQCSYTPGLVVDRDRIDPTFLVPTRVVQTSQVGEVVTPESLAAMRAPGFQRGADGQELGIDFYFPNLGALPGNSNSTEPTLERTEILDSTVASSLSSVRQIVSANDTEAVLGRTIRGLTVFADDSNRPINTVFQLGAQALPDVIPSIEGSENPPNTNINRNLFLAANNSRLPVDSFTVYSAGIGRATSLTPDITSLDQVPAAHYNSLWLGFSPVIDRSLNSLTPGYESTGSQRTIASGGAEGGANSDVSVVSVVNDERFATTDLQDMYAQVYLTLFGQDVNYVSHSEYQEIASYRPHLSFTGNITGSQSLFRYYTGAIAADRLQAYVGADYTRQTLDGWQLQAGGIGYINPDRDYYSQVWGNLNRSIPLGENATLELAAGVTYALDRANYIDNIMSISPASSVAASTWLNVGQVSLGVTNYFGGILPNSYENKLLVDVAVQLHERLRLAAYVAPIEENVSRSRYGASLEWQLADHNSSPTLSLNWANQEYDYGLSASGRDLTIRDDVFTILFRAGS
jgi:hypothetical protein